MDAVRAMCARRQFGPARDTLETFVRHMPSQAEAWSLLAQVCLELRDIQRALAAAMQATMLSPLDAHAAYLVGRAYKADGDVVAAERWYRRALEIAPDDPNILVSLGILVRGRHDVGQAISLYQRALTVDPNHLQGKINLANALAQLAGANGTRSVVTEAGRLREAGSVLVGQGRLQEALKEFEAALRLLPEDADLWLMAGAVLEKMAMPQEILLPYFLEASRLNPTCVPAAQMVRRIAYSAGLPELAASHSDLPSAPWPEREQRIARNLFLPAIQPSHAAIDTTRRCFEQGLDEALAPDFLPQDPLESLQHSAFYLAYHGENDRDLQIKAARVALRHHPSLNFVARHCQVASRRKGRIRIGFVSAFFYKHSIARTSRGLIQHLDRNRFEVHVVRISPTKDDEMTRLICRSADGEVLLDPDLDVARRQIAALELDILFYQDIGMEPRSYHLAFARLAKVQCVSFGHPNTTGIPTIDYFISNDLYEPPDAQGHYSEKLYLLHNLPTLAYYHRPSRGSRSLGRDYFGLPTRGPLYLCPQTLFKVHPDCDALIHGILARSPDAWVVLIRGIFDQWTLALQQRFAKMIPEVSNRILFIPAVSPELFLELLAVIDVVLDTPHFNGMNTSLEAFSVATPVVTLPTRHQRGRHTQAMYQKMGIADCVAQSAAAYVDIAAKLGTDVELGSKIRRQIADRNDILYENLDVVREFERFFLETARIDV